MTPPPRPLDLAGIGLGPFNLSVAALADEIGGLRTAFFERAPEFRWHPGLAFPDSVLQTSFIKDLVTPVCPTSRWSFLNYLVTHGRLYDFLAGRFAAVSRTEFTAYMAWAAAGLPSTRFGADVVAVDWRDAGFQLRMASGASVASRALSVGTGQVPNIPVAAPLGPNCLHVSRYLTERPRCSGKRVVLIGGGQSGAEVMLDLLADRDGPSEIVWLTRRTGFWQLQEGGLVDQIYSPAYQRSYRRFSDRARAQALESQKLSGDGLTPSTADEIYRVLYHRQHLEGRDDVSLRPWRAVTAVEERRGEYRVTAETGDGAVEEVHADVVLLATGYRPAMPACLEPIAHRLGREADGSLLLGDNYRVVWDGPAETPIYALNQGKQSYGIIDPQLSMTAWRSATILNDLVGRQVFEMSPTERAGLVRWAEVEPVLPDRELRLGFG